MSRMILVAAIGITLAGCGQGDIEKAKQLQEQVTRLQGELSTLKAELDAERSGPDRLLARAQNEVATNSSAKAKQTLSDLISRYPESEQAKKSKMLLREIDAKTEAAEKSKLAEEQRKAEEQRQILARLDGNLKKRTDEIEGITWITHKSEPVLATYMSLYFGTKDGKVGNYPLRLKLNYYSDNWLFVQGVTIKADDQIFNLKGLDFERDNGGGRIWEWSDSAVIDRAMLEKIIASKMVTVRFNGRQYYNDFVLPESQKKAMEDIMVAWRRYGGKA